MWPPVRAGEGDLHMPSLGPRREGTCLLLLVIYLVYLKANTSPAAPWI